MSPLRLLAAASLSLAFALPAQAQGTYKIGELNSYKAQPAFLEPYRRAWSWPSTRSTPPAAWPAASSSW